MAKCIPRNDCLPFIMRLFLVVELIIGALFIIFALILQTPPKSGVPIGLIILGGLTLINALFGFIGSCYKRSLLTLYLICGSIITAAQAVLVLYMFGKPGKIASDIHSYKNDTSTRTIRNQLLWVRWILLIFVIMEIVSIIVALVLRCCVDPDGHYGDFRDEEARYNTQMNTMPNSAGGSAAGNTYSNQTGSIASKYKMYNRK